MKTLARPRDKDELLRRLRAVGADSPRRWGRMSAHQMVCHLADAFRMVDGRKVVRDRSSLLQRTVVQWVALYLPVRWPAGIHTTPELDQEHGGTKPAAFAADVAELLALVEEFAGRAESLEGRLHPIFGAMSAAAWLRWGYLHVDHHLRQFGC